MNQQAELPFKAPPIRGERDEPRLWVREFAFYSDFKPEKLVRHLTLRRGLNIVWAKDSDTGASGHAAGKSTFCRLLRYLIGDTHFGTESFRPALRQKFPDAILAGEVILNGEPWLICRPLSNHGYHWCSPGHQLADLFTDALPRKDYSHFTDALQAAFIAPLGVEQYPGTDRDLAWQHLLQWLSRDQDARYADNLQWRASSEAGIPLNHEKTNLIRLVLGHLGETELTKQQKHSEALRERTDLKNLLPKLQYARDRSVSHLSEPFPDLAAKAIDHESKLDELKLVTTRERDRLQDHQRLLNSHDGVGEVLSAKLDHAREVRTSVDGKLQRLRTEIKRRKIQRSYRRNEFSKEEYKRQLATLGDIEGKCSALIELAHEVGCPLAPPIDRDELQLAKIEQIAATAEQLDHFIASLEPQKDRLEAELANADAELAKIAAIVQDKRDQHHKARNLVSNSLQAIQGRLTLLESALNDTTAIREKRERQQVLDGEIKASSDELADLRKGASQVLTTLRNDFSHVASHLTQSEVHGSVSFQSDSIDSSLDYAGDMSSAALVTLRLLIFDLACLLGSVRKSSGHPGFLLHDSPREADLSAAIYRRIFTLIAGPPENEAVQYVIATTEAPPEHLRGDPWLVCEPLSSESPEMRFLRSVV
jgi:uncharacterized protein YydD (DUF2326 family)